MESDERLAAEANLAESPLFQRKYPEVEPLLQALQKVQTHVYGAEHSNTQCTR